MFILQFVGWFVFCCILISFIEHQFHQKFMHKKSFLSERLAGFKKTLEAHAVVHHKHYYHIFSDEPVPVGEDREIRLTVRNGIIKTSPIALLLGLFSWQGAAAFVLGVYVHHKIWNAIHLEMHKPEHRFFSDWPIYRFLARYHCLHHRYPDKNFNVVFPLADYILGTHVRATVEDMLYLQQLGLCTEPKGVHAPATTALAAKNNASARAQKQQLHSSELESAGRR